MMFTVESKTEGFQLPWPKAKVVIRKLAARSWQAVARLGLNLAESTVRILVKIYMADRDPVDVC